MRLKSEIKTYIKESAILLFPDTEVYLFGSRTKENEKGGDIDLLLISDKKIENKKLRIFRVNFYKKFGWQKIDLVNFTKAEDSTFKKLILTEAQVI